MGEDVFSGPSGKIKASTGADEGEALIGQVDPALALEAGVQLLHQAVEIQHIGSGVGELRLG